MLIRASQPAVVLEIGVADRDDCGRLNVELLANLAVGGSSWLKRAYIAESILDDLDFLPVAQEPPATHFPSLSDKCSFLPPNLSCNLLCRVFAGLLYQPLGHYSFLLELMN